MTYHDLDYNIINIVFNFLFRDFLSQSRQIQFLIWYGMNVSILRCWAQIKGISVLLDSSPELERLADVYYDAFSQTKNDDQNGSECLFGQKELEQENRLLQSYVRAYLSALPFVSDDFKDASRLIGKLKNAQKTSDPVSFFLKSKFSSSFRDQIDAYQDKQGMSLELIESLVHELNSLIAKPFYEECHFQEVAEGTKRRLCQKNSCIEELKCANRLLLEDLYHEEIEPKYKVSIDQFRKEKETVIKNTKEKQKVKENKKSEEAEFYRFDREFFRSVLKLTKDQIQELLK